MATTRVPGGPRGAHHHQRRLVPGMHDQGVCECLPRRPVRHHLRRGRSVQLRAVLRVRRLLPRLQRGRGDQLELPRRRRRRRVQAELSMAGGAGHGAGHRRLLQARRLPPRRRPDQRERPGRAGLVGDVSGGRGRPRVGACGSPRPSEARSSPSPQGRPRRTWCCETPLRRERAGRCASPSSRGRTSAATAAALATALGDVAVVCCGDASLDRGTGAVPAFLAGELAAEQALGLVGIHLPQPGVSAPLSLRVERRLDRGRREHLSVSPPCVLSVEAHTARLRRAPLEGVLSSRRATIELVPVRVDGGCGGPPRYRASPDRTVPAAGARRAGAGIAVGSGTGGGADPLGFRASPGAHAAPGAGRSRRGAPRDAPGLGRAHVKR